MQTIYDYSYNEVYDRKIFVFGIMEESINFAMRLVNKGIDFCGFISDVPSPQKYVLARILNKPVIGMDECANIDSLIAVYPSSMRPDGIDIKRLKQDCDVLDEFEFIRDDLRMTKNLVVYGTGKNAGLLLDLFGDELRPSFLCDSDMAKVGKKKYGLDIYQYRELRFNEKDNKISFEMK